MIITIKGNVGYTITLDPSVWIFDDRKIALDDYLKGRKQDALQHPSGNRKPVKEGNETIKKADSKTASYLMPLSPFLGRAEPDEFATEAHLLGPNGELQSVLDMEMLTCSYLLFSIEGSQIKDTGPAHLYVSPSARPIKNFSSIVIH